MALRFVPDGDHERRDAWASGGESLTGPVLTVVLGMPEAAAFSRGAQP